MPPKNFTITEINKIKLQQPMEFVFIKAKDTSFIFQEEDASPYKDDTSRNIDFKQDFYLCAFQTTQEFWKLVVKGNAALPNNPSEFKYPTRPVETVSWLEVQEFLLVLNTLWQTEKGIVLNEKDEKLSGKFQLPSEVQWEFAARGGQALSHQLFAGSDYLDDVGWFINNTNHMEARKTMPVGLKRPNARGLYDMSGNVWEWCGNDYETIDLHGELGINKPTQNKALRGGSCWGNARNCRVRNRGDYHPNNHPSRHNIGFRLLFVPSSSAVG